MTHPPLEDPTELPADEDCPAPMDDADVPTDEDDDAMEDTGPLVDGVASTDEEVVSDVAVV